MSKPILRALGLFTNPNEVTLPDGALVRATNVVIRGKGVIEPRRGFERLSYQPTVSTARELAFFGSTAILHYDSKLAYDSGSAWTELSGSYSAPDSNLRMKFLEAGGNLYFTTSAGPYRMSSASSTPVLAGAPYAPGVDVDKREYTASAGNLVRSSNVVTATTTTAHGFYVGQSVVMTSAGEGTLVNGIKTVASVPSSTSFTYAETAANATSAADQTFAIATVVETGKWLADGYQVAYRVVFDFPDANVKRKLGAPSGRAIIANASGTFGYSATTARNVVVRVRVPSDVTTDCYMQLYRSASVATTIDPGEDLGLVYEVRVKPTDVSAGYIDVKDIVPDELIGPSIYTSPNEGSNPSEGNHRPPLAKDLALWRDRVFYANTQDVQRFSMNLIAVGSPDGLQDGDTIVIAPQGSEFSAGGETFKAATSPGLVTNFDFKLESSGTVAQNIQNTAVNLVSTINRLSTRYYAEYTSGADETPGRIAIWARSVATPAFRVYGFRDGSSATSGRTSWAPVLGALPNTNAGDLSRSGSTVTCDFGTDHSFRVGDRVSVSPGSVNFGVGPHTITATTSTTIQWTESGAAVSLAAQEVTQYDPPTSTADTVANRIHYSKPGEYEAVPLLQYFDVGARNKRIWRVVTLADRLYVFKEDGVFVVTGDAPFRVDEVDPTIPLKSGAADSVVVVDNQVLAVTTKGVVSVTEAGPAIVSEAVNDLFTLASAGSYAFAYESENLYLVRGVSPAGSAGLLVYNTKNQAWSFWDVFPVAARVQPSSDKLWVFSFSTNTIERERKDFLESDYRDRSSTVTLTAYDHTAKTFSITGGTASAGDVIGDSAAVGLVSASDTSVFSTVSATLASLVGGSVTLSKAYECDVQYAAQTNDAPANEKQIADTTWHFRKFKFYAPNAHFTSDKTTTAVDVAIALADRGISHVYTTNSIYRRTMPRNKRVGVPKSMQVHDYLWVGFRVCEAFGYWALNGVTLEGEVGSTKGSR